MKIFQNFNGQTLVEYTLLLGIVIAVLVVLTPMIKMATQGMVKVVADEVGYQQNSEQKNNVGLISTYVNSAFDRKQYKKEMYEQSSGYHTAQTRYDEHTVTNTSTRSDLGPSVEE